MVAPRGSVGMCNVSVSREWDGHGRLVGWSVDARGPVDHASVGFAQARPNYFRVIIKHSPHIKHPLSLFTHNKVMS